jgi:hypothetical protein
MRSWQAAEFLRAYRGARRPGLFASGAHRGAAGGAGAGGDAGDAPDAAVNRLVLVYLNRLSDLLFVMSRYVNGKGAEDVLWVPGAGPPAANRDG